MSAGPIDRTPGARVLAVHASPVHGFSKDEQLRVELVAGHGVAGDTHAGVTVQHRSRVAKDPTQPNLRQVHLLHGELLEALAARGLHVEPGRMGENITTSGLALLEMSAGTVLRLGATARVRVTGLRNPCGQIEAFMPGLLAAVLDRDADGALIRKAGVMGVVLDSGTVAPGDEIVVEQVPAQRVALAPL